MRKRIFALLLAACSLVGCGDASVQTEEVDYTMTFANRTGRDVSKLEIRPSEDSAWSEITLSEAEWKDGYEMPVSMQGQMPLAEDGWQVQMTFADSEGGYIWDGVHFADDNAFTFTIEDGETQVIASAAAEKGTVDDTDNSAEDTVSPAEEAAE